ncbi:MAG: outer membrane protein assembly factor BamD [Candidatus Dadabacteria bacterium]|nr:outer membrane protein assembly factor BamD [Candidatus Dadabacteria bacterium]
MRRIDSLLKSSAVAAISVFVVLSLGCGKKRIGTGEPPDVLYAKATTELAKEGGFPYFLRGPDYDKLFSLLKEIQLRHTYSPYTTLAELRTADAYFKHGEYEQAAVEYGEFIKRHPSHKETPYATYRLGLAHYRQKHAIDRDPTSLREASKWLSYFKERHSRSELAPEAEKLYKKTRKLLAKREMYIANYYWKKKNYKATSMRYNTVVVTYGDTTLVEEALYKLGKCYHKMGEDYLAVASLERIVTEYPNEKYHKKAAKLISKIKRKQSKKAEN